MEKTLGDLMDELKDCNTILNKIVNNKSNLMIELMPSEWKFIEDTLVHRIRFLREYKIDVKETL